MAESEKSIIGELEKLALITDAVQDIFPKGTGAIVFELDPNDFYRVKNYFKQLVLDDGRFKIDISGLEVIFILRGSIEIEIQKEEEENQKRKQTKKDEEIQKNKVEENKNTWKNFLKKLRRKISG